MEGGNLYNSVNLSLGVYGDPRTDAGEMYTAWVTIPASWLCPSDGKNGNGLVNYSGDGNPNIDPMGQSPSGLPPINPATGLPSPLVPVTNYIGSWGDNCAGCGLGSNLPWEHVPGVPIPPGGWRIGWPGYWGTNHSDGFDGGSLRGFMDYATMQIASIDSTTDGTSNTILVGEGLPDSDGNLNFWGMTGALGGTTVPLGWNSNSFPASDPTCAYKWQNASAPPGCRYSAAAKGFRSRHPGGSNILFADGSVHFLKNTISLMTYTSLGSRNGGEVVSSGAY
jgi:prepilin-type processing-associated H-X9-DG protein